MFDYRKVVINEGDTIIDLISQYSVNGLKIINEILELPSLGSFKKAKIVEILAIELTNSTNYLEMLRIFTQKERELLLKLLQSKKLLQLDDFNRNFEFLIINQLINVITIDGKECIYIDPIIRKAMLEAIKIAHTNNKKYRNTKEVKVISGIVNTYGVIRGMDIIKMLLEDDDVDFEKDSGFLDKYLYIHTPLDNVYFMDGYLINSSINICDPSDFDGFNINITRKVKEYLIFSNIETMYEKEDNWHELYKFLLKYKLNKKQIYNFRDYIFREIQNSNSPTDLIYFIAEEIEIKSEDDLGLLANIIMNVNNNTPMWCNGGLTPNEMGLKPLDN